MRKLVIDRKVWLRGEGSLVSELHRKSDGKMCCLGIYLESCGIPRESMTGRGGPFKMFIDSHTEPPEEARWLLDPHGYTGQCTSVIASELMTVNDERGDDALRERRVKALFAQAGVDVEFVG